MDPDAFTASLFKWDPRGLVAAAAAQHQQQQSASASAVARAWEQQQQLGGLEELFEAYGIRYYTAAKIAELGFTARTLVNMRDEELDDMMTSLSHIFRWDLLVGERYGIKAAVRAHRRRLDHTSDALSQEGVSEEPVVQHVEKEMVVSGGDGGGEAAERRRKQRRGRGSKGGKAHRKLAANIHQLDEDENDAVAGEDDEHHISREVEEDDVVGGGRSNSNNNGGGGGGAGASASAIDMVMMSMSERQREHPFIVTEPGEVARGKKNGLDYLFHLYDQCRDFLIQVQNRAKERGDKCPTKVTNEVFRYAKKAGASHINKPKMRHYVHCYALHCLDEQASNALRRAYKERGENVGSWRDACYQPVVDIAGRQAAWDIDSVFNSHPLLSIWYVPTKLRHLCHAQRNNNNNNASATSLLHVAAQSHHHPRLSF